MNSKAIALVRCSPEADGHRVRIQSGHGFRTDLSVYPDSVAAHGRLPSLPGDPPVQAVTDGALTLATDRYPPFRLADLASPAGDDLQGDDAKWES